MNKVRKLITVASLGAMMLTMSACGGSASQDRIKIGVKYDQPGLGLKEGNKFTGFDVEIAKYIAKDLGYPENKIDWVESVSAQRETMISAGQVKFIVASYSITDARKKRVSFAGPYFIAGQDLLVKADNTDITGPEKLAGKKLCSVSGSTPAQKIKKQYPGVDLQTYDTYSKCVDALANGSIDAMTTDDSVLAGYAAQGRYAGKLKLVGKPFTDELYGIGIKKGDVKLCKKINKSLEKMIEKGAWKKIFSETLGKSGFKPSDKNPPKPAECS